MERRHTSDAQYAYVPYSLYYNILVLTLISPSTSEKGLGAWLTPEGVWLTGGGLPA